MKKIIIVLTLFLLSACGSSRGNFIKAREPENDEALVYVYRPSRHVGRIISYTVFEGNNRVVQLKNGVYRPYYTTPGKKKFTAKTESTSEIEMDLVGGQTYFLEGSIGFGVLVGRPKFKEIKDSTTAFIELETCNIMEN